ncbi:MAG: vacuolar iron transporter family protein [Frankiaceae bacterium]|jgi:VIT1/CCC1 family predicted Fe2+/Mn2+ transporter|nr:vacuolar iron transporter family protein [Frankiaceae bacterium]
MVGVAASSASGAGIVTAGVAGVVAGAMAMAAGEYVSVSSQRDVEEADRSHETREQARDPEGERRQLVGIYQSRGLPRPLAEEVANIMHATDPVAAHMREQLGHTEQTKARPSQAAVASAASFIAGGLIPFLGLMAPSRSGRLISIAAVTILGLACAGILGARVAGVPMTHPTVRVVLGGSAAMAVTALVGHLVHLSGA